MDKTEVSSKIATDEKKVSSPLETSVKPVRFQEEKTFKDVEATENKNNWKAWLYLAPVLILMSVFTFFPLINTFVVSFLKDYNSGTGTSSGFTFQNYGVVLGVTPRVKNGPLNGDFISFSQPSALVTTLFITVVTVPISIILSLMISIGINNIKGLKKFFQTVFFMPYVTNVIAVGMVFAVMFGVSGPINAIFHSTINWINPEPSNNPWVSWFICMVPLCFYIIWVALPYKILIFLSGLQGIDQQYYDAAKIDGAPKWKINLKITVPLLSPQILYITITSFISAFKEYNAVIGLFNRSYSASKTSHDLYTVVYYIYDKLGDGTTNTQYASAAAVILFVIIMLITLVQMQVSKKRVHY